MSGMESQSVPSRSYKTRSYLLIALCTFILAFLFGFGNGIDVDQDFGDGILLDLQHLDSKVLVINDRMFRLFGNTVKL